MAGKRKAEDSPQRAVAAEVRHSSGRSGRSRDRLSAGDLCRDEGKTAEALGFYAEINAYERMLSLDLSLVLFEKIGGQPFLRIALDIAEHCPEKIKRDHPLSMLRIAWALKTAGLDAAFNGVLDDLDGRIEESGGLRGEWLLLSAYRHFPRLEDMLPLVRKAAPFFNGACSKVILPEAPWCSGGYFQLSEFHVQAGEVDREADALEEFIALYSRLTGGHGSGADALFRAETAYMRCDMPNAEILAYKTMFLAEGKRQSIIQFGAAKILADIALIKADAAGWRQAIEAMERVAARPGPGAFVNRLVLDTVRGSILAELHCHANIASWLKEGDFSALPLLPSMRSNALYVHVTYLLHRKELARFIGTQNAIPAEVVTKTAFSAFLFPFLMAIGYFFAGGRSQAAGYLEHAAEKAMPDGFILPFAASSWLLDGLIENLTESRYPSLFDAFNTAKMQFGIGWETLHDAVSRNELPADLTAREREIAHLAARGLRNSEIAERLGVTENTVRAHLRAIFQKLDIDRRARLVAKLE